MEVTVIFRDMTPKEALITLVKGLIDAREPAVRGSLPRLQVSIRKTYAVHVSSALSSQSWAATDDDAARAVRTAFERFDRARADDHAPRAADSRSRQSARPVLAREGESLGAGKLGLRPQQPTRPDTREHP